MNNGLLVGKKALKLALKECLVAWSEQEKIDFYGVQSGVFITINFCEKLKKRITDSIVWEDSPIIDNEIRGLLKCKITKEPRIILEEMLRSGAREITEEMIGKLISEGKLHAKKGVLGPVFLKSSTHNKASNLNCLLVRLRLPYRISSIQSPDGPYRLCRVKLVKKTLCRKSKVSNLVITGTIKIRGARKIN